MVTIPEPQNGNGFYVTAKGCNKQFGSASGEAWYVTFPETLVLPIALAAKWKRLSQAVPGTIYSDEYENVAWRRKFTYSGATVVSLGGLTLEWFL